MVWFADLSSADGQFRRLNHLLARLLAQPHLLDPAEVVPARARCSGARSPTCGTYERARERGGAACRRAGRSERRRGEEHRGRFGSRIR